MAAEPNEAPADEQDPETDTPEGEAQEPTEDTPQPEQQVEDFEARYKEAQKVIARQGHELGLLRAGETPPPDEEAEEPDEGTEVGEPSGANPAYVERLEKQSLELAASLYGQEAIAAYDSVHPILTRAVTMADYMAGLEAYHELRSKGATPKEAAAAKAKGGAPTRDEALKPRVDANRSDAGPDPSVVAQLEEARKKGGPESFAKFVHAATRQLGFGSEKGQPGR
jgi:hypothetical protein